MMHYGGKMEKDIKEILELARKIARKLDEQEGNPPQELDTCPNCVEGKMIGNATKEYPTNPPKYEYVCNKCDFVEIK